MCSIFYSCGKFGLSSIKNHFIFVKEEKLFGDLKSVVNDTLKKNQTQNNYQNFFLFCLLVGTRSTLMTYISTPHFFGGVHFSSWKSFLPASLVFLLVAWKRTPRRCPYLRLARPLEPQVGRAQFEDVIGQYKNKVALAVSKNLNWFLK